VKAMAHAGTMSAAQGCGLCGVRDKAAVGNTASGDTKLHLAMSMVLMLWFFPTLSSAEITTDSYTCTLASESRTITLTYLNNIYAVPCEIREEKNSNGIRTLWRAENDVAFCGRQFDTYRNRLESNGWPCTDDSSDAASTPAVFAPKFSKESTEAPIAAALPAEYEVLSDENETQVVFVEDSSTLTLQNLPTLPPSGKYGNLTPDDIRDMDDWLIYLSAQTMASIRALTLDVSTFEDYLQREARDSRNIYERLQNRIEFLNQLTTAN